MSCLDTQDAKRAVLVAGCLALLLTAASGVVAGQEADLTVQPEDSEVREDETTTLEVVVEGAGNGVGVHDIELSLADSAVAEIVDITFVKEPLTVQSEATVSDNGTTAVGVGAMGSNTYDGASEIAVLEVTVQGKALNESTELGVVNGSAVGDTGGMPYSIGSFGSATVSVVEEPSGDGDGGSDGLGPGFGVLAPLLALVAAGSLRYVAGRR